MYCVLINTSLINLKGLLSPNLVFLVVIQQIFFSCRLKENWGHYKNSQPNKTSKKFQQKSSTLYPICQLSDLSRIFLAGLATKSCLRLATVTARLSLQLNQLQGGGSTGHWIISRPLSNTFSFTNFYYFKQSVGKIYQSAELYSNLN